jgi:hypothetical protein
LDEALAMLDRSELVQKAKDLGIEVKVSWGLPTLRQHIKTAIDQGADVP